MTKRTPRRSRHLLEDDRTRNWSIARRYRCAQLIGAAQFSTCIGNRLRNRAEHFLVAPAKLNEAL